MLCAAQDRAKAAPSLTKDGIRRQQMAVKRVGKKKLGARLSDTYLSNANLGRRRTSMTQT